MIIDNVRVRDIVHCRHYPKGGRQPFLEGKRLLPIWWDLFHDRITGTWMFSRSFELDVDDIRFDAVQPWLNLTSAEQNGILNKYRLVYDYLNLQGVRWETFREWEDSWLSQAVLNAPEQPNLGAVIIHRPSAQAPMTAYPGPVLLAERILRGILQNLPPPTDPFPAANAGVIIPRIYFDSTVRRAA